MTTWNQAKEQAAQYQQRLAEVRHKLGCDVCEFRDVCIFQIRFEKGHCIRRECNYQPDDTKQEETSADL